jgi:exopolyphosphatase/guanosine-5'-triphosphate,3'-diphosphate pyrophosphatase
VAGPSDDHRAAAPAVQLPADFPPGGDAASAVAPPQVVSSPARGPERGRPIRPACSGRTGEAPGPLQPVYAALDLGTNNCRLLVARPTPRGFRVLDAFSRIIRLGEGVTTSGRLSEAAMARTWEALTICAAKMRRHHVLRSRLVATEACRIADNGAEFVAHVARRLGLKIEILSREAEAMLAVSGCLTLLDVDCDLALVFDIGGGSSELIWLDLARGKRAQRRSLTDRREVMSCIAAWTSLPVGVVTLAERFGGRHVTEHAFEAMVEAVTDLLAPFEAEHRFRERLAHGKVHFLGASGTVTTVAGIQLGLPRYDRRRVDGCWLDVADARAITYDLLARSYEERVAEPCIGRERADFVLPGCAILEALLRMWPADRLRVADRGLREGILATLMARDGHFFGPARKGRRPRRDT